MTTRLDYVANKHRLRTRGQRGLTWDFPWETLTEAEREQWRGNIRAILHDLDTFQPEGDTWQTFAECGHVHVGANHDRPTRDQCAGHEREVPTDE